MLFGDSIGFGVGDYEKGGWATQLRLAIDRAKKDKTHNLINLSVSGDTTRSLLARFEREVKVRIRPEETKENYTLILAIGTNDARVDRENVSRNINLDEYRDNLRHLIDIAQKYFCRIIIMGLPAVDELRTAPFKEQNYYLNDNLVKYEQIARKIAKLHNCEFMPLHRLFPQEIRTSLLEDGLHPNTEGHHIIFEAVRQEVTYC